MDYWTVPPMWTGRTVAVLASGPSMSQAVADSVRHLPRIAINSTYRLAPDADIVYSSDGIWWAEHTQALRGPGRKVCIEIRPGVAPVIDPAIQLLRNTGIDGFDPDPACLRTTNNSGSCGIQLAVHAGAARILLLGFDMRGGHWHGDHAKPLSNPDPRRLRLWVSGIAKMATGLPRGVQIINCTPASALRCFPMQPLAEALAESLQAAA